MNRTTKIIVLIVLLLSAMVFRPVNASQELLIELEPAWVTAEGQPTDQWLMQLTPHRDDNEVSPEVHSLNFSAEILEHPLFRRIFRVTVPEDDQSASLLTRLETMNGVVWAESAPVRQICALPQPRDGVDAPPNDPYYPLQWSLDRVQADAAWDVTRGDTNIVIAVVDVGIDIYHGDLLNQLWTNRLEADGQDGVDDDGNGFIDDLHGWDFYEDDADPRPPLSIYGHGTHVAGIACAAVDNGYGIAGVGWNCRLMAIRAGERTTILHGYEGIIYAAASGADIINLSWGSGNSSNIERITTEFAAEQGALIVAAAGNLPSEGTHFPGAYSNVLAVSAVQSGDLLASFSNYGEWVGICAPGQEILSSVPGGFGVISGTSMATPMVSGAAALVKSIHPDWGPEQIMMQLIMSADRIDDLNPHFVGQLGGGRLNLFRAVSDVRSGFGLMDVVIDDQSEGDGDGVIEPGERVQLTVTIKNLLMQSASPLGRLTSIDPYIQITPATFDFGDIGPSEEADNSSAPFCVRIDPDARSGREIECQLELFGQEMTPQSFQLTLSVRPAYDDHNVGNVALTLTNFGAIGYYDYRKLLSDGSRGEGVGQGFRYPADGLSGLFHGSLMIGVPYIVSDCAYGDNQMGRFDFSSMESGFVVNLTESGDQEGHTVFHDGRAEHPLNVTVRQDSYSYSDHPDDDYVIIRYTITNGGTDRDSMYVGLYLDWDVVESGRNYCRWDEEDCFGWVEYDRPGWTVYGAAVVDQSADFNVAVPNSYIFTGGSNVWNDAEKFELMLLGFNYATGDEVSDWSQMIGVGPLSVDRGDSVDVTFVLSAGDDPDDLAANIRAARDRWTDQRVASGV
ncbi:MAG: S8 family serine peptidase, partial [Candidatus Electryoneaceae bacterium]|nr:S8 family serine peptidase [Candidatus Electryoneaceae bacterium]